MSALVKIISYKLTFIHLGRKGIFQAIRQLSEFRAKEPGLGRNKCQDKILPKGESAWESQLWIVLLILSFLSPCFAGIAIVRWLKYLHITQMQINQNHRQEYVTGHVLAAKEVGKRNFCPLQLPQQKGRPYLPQIMAVQRKRKFMPSFASQLTQFN